MSLHVNINGSKKILSSVYANIDGASKKLSALYANVSGSSKDLLAVKYAWKRYAATKWENVVGTWNPYDEDRTCSFDSSVTHSYRVGYVEPWGRPYTSYDSFSFTPSTGNFTGLNGEEFDVITDIDTDSYEITGTNPYYRWIFAYSNKQEIFRISNYNFTTYCKQGTTYESVNSGFDVVTYRYAKPTTYSDSYDIVTSTKRYAYPDNGEDYRHSDVGSYYYTGYKYEYIGQL